MQIGSRTACQSILLGHRQHSGYSSYTFYTYQNSVAHGPYFKLSSQLSTGNKIIRFKVSIAEKSRERPTVSEIGLAATEIWLRGITFKLSAAVTQTGKQTPTVREVVLKLELMAYDFRIDRSIAGLSRKSMTRRKPKSRRVHNTAVEGHFLRSVFQLISVAEG